MRDAKQKAGQLLGEGGIRSLARAIGGLDHIYLSRMVAGKAAVNAHHAARVARYFGLPEDYFPEVREAVVIAEVRSNSQLRDEIYFGRVRRSRR